jgi:DNA polymerase I-like protein with 3'-5' exonuclease and polymerase domains
MAKLNVQATARRDPGLMSAIIPSPGHVFVSSDASAGEPTVTTHYSGDKNYYDACFGMVGKAPYYDGLILRISDIYLMTMSVSPIGAEDMRECFHSKFGGVSFAEQWLIDDEVIKKQLKTQRTFHKILALGLGYGMGPKKMCKSAYEKGYALEFNQAKAFFKSYWSLFSGVRALSDRLAEQVEQDGFIVNQFGYRLVPEPHKAFNYLIQSTVSGIMHVYCAKIFAAAPWARFVTVIHDELIAEIPENKVEEFRQVIAAATDSLNADLNWSVKLRFGYVVGRNLFEAK